MRVFMLGWEFPPFISGGLGTACYGLTQALSHLGVEVVFALPRLVGKTAEALVKKVCPGAGATVSARRRHIEFRGVDAFALGAYAHPQAVPCAGISELEKDKGKSTLNRKKDCTGIIDQYGGDMLAEVFRYANSALELSFNEQYDVIHAHDWMTFPAGAMVSSEAHKPLVVHVHSTEFDRSGEHVNQAVYDIERQGLHDADRVIAVSHRTRSVLVERYGIPEAKVKVVYNGVIRNGRTTACESGSSDQRRERIVLFLGRVTMQKGPEYFLKAAKRVLDYREDVLFIMAGSGDQLNQCIEMASALGIGHRVLFTGFLRGDDVRRIYEMADLYVMPSVSEPFGIAPLEAMDHDVPVLISKQSGVAEVLSHVLKVDFWDTREMANKIIAVLKHPPLHEALRLHGAGELERLDWANAAHSCISVYSRLIMSQINVLALDNP